MKTAILLAPRHVYHECFYGPAKADAISTVTDAYVSKQYQKVEVILGNKPADPEAAADECFDLTNNPIRQAEREARYGRGRSVSVGDIVEAGDVAMLCMPSGWHRL